MCTLPVHHENNADNTYCVDTNLNNMHCLNIMTGIVDNDEISNMSMLTNTMAVAARHVKTPHGGWRHDWG